MSRQASDRLDSPQSGRDSPPGDVEHAAGKPYRRPSLQTYGRLAEVTRFGGSQILDSGGNLQNP
jgi:hypothetical protein